MVWDSIKVARPANPEALLAELLVKALARQEMVERENLDAGPCLVLPQGMAKG